MFNLYIVYLIVYTNTIFIFIIIVLHADLPIGIPNFFLIGSNYV